MKISSYLNFDGTCEAAFKFYEATLGGKISAMMPFGSTPACDHVPESHRDKIMHARITVGDQELMGSDCIPAHPYEGIKGCSVSLQLNDVGESKRIFKALSENGIIEMPLQETFWAARFGMVKDQFGVPWMVNCEQASAK